MFRYQCTQLYSLSRAAFQPILHRILPHLIITKIPRSLHSSFSFISSCSSGAWSLLLLRYFRVEGRKLIPHVLCMASIDYCDGVAIYRVGEVPLIGISHVVASPLRDGWFSLAYISSISSEITAYSCSGVISRSRAYSRLTAR